MGKQRKRGPEPLTTKSGKPNMRHLHVRAVWEDWYEELREQYPPIVPVQGKEEIKRQLMATVEAAVDAKLATLYEGQGLGILFRLDMLNEDGTILEERNPRHTPQAIEWRKQVFERDVYTCQDCKQYGGKLQAHHKEEWAEAPHKRFDLDNGVTLCVECHAKRHPERANLIRKARYFDGEAVKLHGRSEEGEG